MKENKVFKLYDEMVYDYSKTPEENEKMTKKKREHNLKQYKEMGWI